MFNRERMHGLVLLLALGFVIATATPFGTVHSEPVRRYLNPHDVYNRAMGDPSFMVAAVYGTPVGGSDERGWGSANNGYEEPNFDPHQNFHDGADYISGLVSKETVPGIDAVVGYGEDEYGDTIFVQSSVDFILYAYQQGGVASANLRPSGNDTMDDLYQRVDRLWTGQAKYADGTPVFTEEFVRETGVPLSLDLEVMLEGQYPNGVPAVELNKIFNRYREIMKSYGYQNPVILLYERGLGEFDMVDDVSQLDTTGLVVIYSGFVPSGDLAYKIQGTKDLVAAYGQRRGGCMGFRGWSNHMDGFSLEDEAYYYSQDVCALAILQ